MPCPGPGLRLSLSPGLSCPAAAANAKLGNSTEAQPTTKPRQYSWQQSRQQKMKCLSEVLLLVTSLPPFSSPFFACFAAAARLFTPMIEKKRKKKT